MEPGEPISVVMTKWGDRPHWEFEGVWLGSDEHGDWLGFPRGTFNHRPGYRFHSEVDSVTLLPRDGWFCATFHAPGIWCDLYVDIATPPVLDGTTVRSVDLDLDVIRLSQDGPRPPWENDPSTPPGGTFVDDEDEFAEHRVAFEYPDDVVREAEAAAASVRSQVEAGRAPYDGPTAAGWLTALRRLGAPPSTPAP